MEITIQLFGAFSAYGSTINIDTKETSLVSDIRHTFFNKIREIDDTFDAMDLINSSRFATESAILSEDAKLIPGMRIFIIPPVSGG